MNDDAQDNPARWRAPSDATATVWLEELEAAVPDKE
jgi:hypothetical protein